MSQGRSSVRSAVKKFDIFSLPFKFNLGDEGNEKRTFVGGLFSLLIILSTSLYFSYLCYLYFSNKLQPTISSQNQYSYSSFQMGITQSFIAIKVMIKGKQTLYDFQKEKGKVYLNVVSLYSKNGNQSKNQSIYRPLIPCEDESLANFMCIDLKSVYEEEDYVMDYEPNSNEKYNFSIFLNVCEQNKQKNGDICEDEQVIRKTLITYDTEIVTRIGLRQYNPKTKEFEDRIKEEIFYFDGNVIFYTKFILQKTDIAITEGLIIQQTDNHRYFSDFIRRDIFASQAFIVEEMKQKMLGGLVFFIGQEGINLSIQYAQFTSLLAQFTSVFNSLLFLGIFSKVLAQSEILQNFAELQLKTYYKKTAELLVEDVCDKQDVKEAKSGGTINMWKLIQKMDFVNIYKRLNITFLQRIKFMLMTMLMIKTKKKKEDNSVKVFRQLVDQSNKSLNIFEIQKELIQLKIMIRLLISVEQFAAMKLCGSKVPVCSASQINKANEQQQLEVQQMDDIKESELNTPHISKLVSQSVQMSDRSNPHSKKSASIIPLEMEDKQLNKKHIIEKCMNHLEQIDLVESDQTFLSKYVDQFLVNNNSTSSELNKRIFGCMIGLEQDQEQALHYQLTKR